MAKGGWPRRLAHHYIGITQISQNLWGGGASYNNIYRAKDLDLLELFSGESVLTNTFSFNLSP